MTLPHVRNSVEPVYAKHDTSGQTCYKRGEDILSNGTRISQKQENGMAVVRLRESAKPNKGKVIRIVGRQNVESA